VKPLRFVFRLSWLLAMLVIAGLDAFLLSLRHGFRAPLAARTRWLQRHARQVSRVFVARVELEGKQPAAGLLVCNHISYVDILVLAAMAPAVFVAKSEVARWPVFGWFAQFCGTIFVRRGVRADVARVGAEIRDRLHRGFLVVVFPEGTSSNGNEVLPFRSSLLEPVVEVEREVIAGHLGYERPGCEGDPEVGYWGDMTLVPHMTNLLARPRVLARVSFGAPLELPDCRKELARHLHAEVRRLKAPAF
jgi:1-acyl-sn-glycerol-3-phosphate acyltransferase